MPVPATRPTQRRWRTSLAALAAIGMGSVAARRRAPGVGRTDRT